METRSRLMFVDAGFPAPRVNDIVRHRHGGWLLEGDLVWRDKRVVGEYQGGHRADRARRSAARCFVAWPEPSRWIQRT
jgi:hypothetical protein